MACKDEASIAQMIDCLEDALDFNIRYLDGRIQSALNEIFNQDYGLKKKLSNEIGRAIGREDGIQISLNTFKNSIGARVDNLEDKVDDIDLSSITDKLEKETQDRKNADSTLFTDYVSRIAQSLNTAKGYTDSKSASLAQSLSNLKNNLQGQITGLSSTLTNIVNGKVNPVFNWYNSVKCVVNKLKDNPVQFLITLLETFFWEWFEYWLAVMLTPPNKPTPTKPPFNKWEC